MRCNLTHFVLCCDPVSWKFQESNWPLWNSLAVLSRSNYEDNLSMDRIFVLFQRRLILLSLFVLHGYR